MAANHTDTTDIVLDEDLQVLPLEGSKSEVWKYFGFPAANGKFIEPDKKKRKEVLCKILGCTKNNVTYSGNTSNMRFHIQQYHPSVLPRLSSSSSSKADQSSKQLSISEAFEGYTPLPKTSARWKRLTESVCYFLAKDMNPIDTVNDPGFRKMIREFEPRYAIPDRKTFRNNYIPVMYEREKKHIGTLVTNASSFSITTDLWSSRTMQSYIGLTIHFTDMDFNLHSYLLDTKEFSDSHTGENMAEELATILKDWNLLQTNLVCATTDNGSNILKAVDILGWQHMPCFSHTLQLAVEAAMKLPAVTRAIARCKRLVAHFHHSVNSTKVFHEKQASLDHPKLCLVQDVSTRWSSSYYMMQRILTQQQPLCATLLEVKRGDLMPSDGEFTVMESYVKVMKPLVEITEIMGAQKWVTISAVRPLLHKLLKVSFEPSVRDSAVERSMKQAMKQNLTYRYQGTTTEFLNKACFLDPRFRSLPFLSSDEKEVVYDKIFDEMIEIISSCSSSEESQDATEHSGHEEPPPKKSRLLDLLGDVIQHSDTSKSDPKALAKQELDRFKSEEPVSEDPLKWWNGNKSRFPGLAVLAGKYFSPPATSVPSERAFSLCGHIVNRKRSCLLPENVRMLSFLAENLD